MSKNKKKQQDPPILRNLRWVFPKIEAISPFLANRIATWLFFSPIRPKEPKKHHEFRKTAITKSAEIRGKTVYYYQWGEGDQTVIFSHGWMGRATQFQKFVPYFTEAGYKVVAFDGPAHGQSEGRSTDLYEFSDTISHILSEEGPSHFVGHSFGGVAGVFAQNEGHHLKSITTIGSPTVSEYIIQEFCDRINVSNKVGQYFQSYVIKKYGRPFSEASIIEMTSRIEPLPFLMIHDEDDDEVPVKHAEENIRRNPWLKLEKTTGLGHYKILKSKSVIELTLNFITNTDNALQES